MELSYQEYISQFVEIIGMPNSIKNVELGHQVKRCNINNDNTSRIDLSHDISLQQISSNLYNLNYLINDLILHSNEGTNKIICKIKKKCKIYFLDCPGSYNVNKPPELIINYVNDGLYDFTHIQYVFYLHKTNIPIEFTFMPNLLCIFKFDDFEYTSENDYITKNMLTLESIKHQYQLLHKTNEEERINDKEKIKKLEQENQDLKERLKRIEDKIFMPIEHKYF